MNSYQPSAMTEKFVEYLDCPCEVLAPTETMGEVMKRYREALIEGGEQGFTPVMVTVDGLLWSMLFENVRSAFPDKISIPENLEYQNLPCPDMEGEAQRSSLQKSQPTNLGKYLHGCPWGDGTAVLCRWI